MIKWEKISTNISINLLIVTITIKTEDIDHMITVEKVS